MMSCTCANVAVTCRNLLSTGVKDLCPAHPEAARDNVKIRPDNTSQRNKEWKNNNREYAFIERKAQHITRLPSGRKKQCLGLFNPFSKLCRRHPLIPPEETGEVGLIHKTYFHGHPADGESGLT